MKERERKRERERERERERKRGEKVNNRLTTKRLKICNTDIIWNRKCTIILK